MERYQYFCDFDFDIDALLETIKSFQKYDFDTRILFDDLKRKIFKKDESIIYYYYGKNQFSIFPKGNEEFVDLEVLIKEDKFYLPEDAYFILEVNRTDERFEVSLKDVSKWLYESNKFTNKSKRHITLNIDLYKEFLDILSNNLKMIFNYKLSYAKKFDVNSYWKNKFKNILLESIMNRFVETHGKQTLVYFYKLKNPIPIIPNGNVEFVDLDKLLDSIEHSKIDKFCLPEDTYITLCIREIHGLSHIVEVKDVSKWLNDEYMSSKEDKK